MSMVISLLYLLLNIGLVVLVAYGLLWALRWLEIPIDGKVLKVCQFILAVIVLILIASWFAGVLPPRGVFGRLSGPQYDVPFRLALLTFA
jgi:hypothetical protein